MTSLHNVYSFYRHAIIVEINIIALEIFSRRILECRRKRTQEKTYPGENVPKTWGTFSLGENYSNAQR